MPFTASSPIEPPGNTMGVTTKLSVVMATGAPPTITRAASLRRSPSSGSAGPKSSGAKRPSTSRRDALPPAPWAISICGSRNRSGGEAPFIGASIVRPASGS